MPARIESIRDGQTESLIPIEATSIQVGGAAPSDIVFHGLPHHVFSLEYTDETYWILNTGETTLFLDESVVHAGSQIQWEPGEVLQISRDFTLKLETDSNPAPKPQKQTFLGIKPRRLLTEPERTERDRQTRLLLMLGGILACICFLSFQIIFSRPDPQRFVRAEFSHVLEQLESGLKILPDVDSRHSDRRNLGDLIDAFKRARVAELEHAPETAQATYEAIQRQIKDQYLGHDGRSFSNQVFEEISQYAWQRQISNGLEVDSSVR